MPEVAFRTFDKECIIPEAMKTMCATRCTPQPLQSCSGPGVTNSPCCCKRIICNVCFDPRSMLCIEANLGKRQGCCMWSRYEYGTRPSNCAFSSDLAISVLGIPCHLFPCFTQSIKRIAFRSAVHVNSQYVYIYVCLKNYSYVYIVNSNFFDVGKSMFRYTYLHLAILMHRLAARTQLFGGHWLYSRQGQWLSRTYPHHALQEPWFLWRVFHESSLICLLAFKLKLRKCMFIA